MNQWQPIDTAPRDGTVILGLDSREDEWPMAIRYETFTLKDGTREGWWSPCESLIADVIDQIYPTHWMPLPEPPKEDQ